MYPRSSSKVQEFKVVKFLLGKSILISDTELALKNRMQCFVNWSLLYLSYQRNLHHILMIDYSFQIYHRDNACFGTLTSNINLCGHVEDVV